MLSRRYLVGAAVILAGALGLTAARVAFDSGAAVEAAPSSARHPGGSEVGATPLARPAGARRSAGGLSGGAGPDAPDPEPGREAEPPRFGWVRGLVADLDGAPVTGAAIAFQFEGSRWMRRQAVSDGLGEFALDDVPVGSWRVEHETRRPPVWERMRGVAGTIEVLENRETWVPVLLEGERRLTGTIRMNLEGFSVQGDQGFMIDLQLRPEWDPDVTVARGSIHSFVSPPWEGGPSEPLDPEDDVFRNPEDADETPEEREEWIAGAFRFEHLRAGRYELRIQLEDNEWVTTRIDGEQRRLHLYLEREVDLTHGDVELPPEQLDFWRDFMGAALERE